MGLIKREVGKKVLLSFVNPAGKRFNSSKEAEKVLRDDRGDEGIAMAMTSKTADESHSDPEDPEYELPQKRLNIKDEGEQDQSKELAYEIECAHRAKDAEKVIDPELEAVHDSNMKEILKDMVGAETDDCLQIVENHSDAIANYGYPKIYGAKLVDKKEIVDILLKQNFVYSVHAEFTQFIDGMNSIGQFGDIGMRNKSVFKAILSNRQEKLTSTTFKSLYEIVYSEKGSNKRNQEESTIYCLELFLKDLEDSEIENLVLEDLLVFATGAECAPPLGFSRPVAIEFFDYGTSKR
ncbi:hypothetical protein QZH41_002500 [Actinostola sp. cb2023]|nr:hypothetical protein QZH41_002500 [Actinostola sp. cb2023]